ncbi:MAG: hypothetical protein QG622_1156 [Actinomycetota bacterium]|nr:hypothetical protein [Actinomycetota bacterium]
MTTFTCPDGHASTMGDYCDVCGMPIPAVPGAPAVATAPPAPGAAAFPPATFPPAAFPAAGNALDLDAPFPPAAGGFGAAPVPPESTDRTCPHCGAPNLPDALFCEDCGYDFTTGQLPRPLDPPLPAPVVPAPVDPVDLGAPDAVGPAADTDPVDIPAPVLPDAVIAPPVTPTSVPGHVEWVAEVWIDPDWYASQDVTDSCPSPGMPWVIPVLERTVLIGRVSASRNIHPQIDIAADSGVSRRHAQLSSDGQRWWVEDLQSANGTYVGAAGEPLPLTPIPSGQRIELAEDDRVYLGAWSRVVVRRATPEESTLGS